MDRDVAIILVIVAAIGMLATFFILRRQRLEAAAEQAESPFAASTEGEKRCSKCGMGSLWTDAFCVSSGSRLPG